MIARAARTRRQNENLGPDVAGWRAAGCAPAGCIGACPPGIGMNWELPLAHYAKRLVMIDHQLGDEDHHLQRYIDLGRQAGAA